MQLTPENQRHNPAIVEHLLGIIDTKLQFIEYYTAKILNAIVDEPDETAAQEFPALPEVDIEKMEHNNVIDHIEAYSRTTYLLLFIRANLHEKNASTVFDLLAENKYLNYSGKELEKKLSWF